MDRRSLTGGVVDLELPVVNVSFRQFGARRPRSSE